MIYSLFVVIKTKLNEHRLRQCTVRRHGRFADALPEIQDILGYRKGLDPGGSDWPIYAKGLLQTGKGSPAPVLPRLAR